MNVEEIAIDMFDAGIVKFGNFTYKSGLTGPIYLDHSNIACSPKLLEKAALAYTEKMNAQGVKKMCAVPYKAIVIGAVVAIQSNIPMLFTRKEVKEYGTKKLIEGIYTAGEEVAIIEDLATTGISIIEVAHKLRQAGLIVKDAFVNVDREQGGRANLAKEGIQLHANMTLSQMLDVYVKHGKITKEKSEEVKKYIAQNQKTY